MNGRKKAFINGLSTIAAQKGRAAMNPRSRICATASRVYTARGMLQPNQIINGDSIEILNAEPEGWVDLCFADPPFNIGYLYHNYDDKKDVDEYVNWSEKWMKAVHRALKPSGSFYLAIGDEFAADLCHVARRRIGFHLRNWIIWHYTFGQSTRKMFAKSHTHILYFTKEKEGFTFNADDVRVASARQTTYADNRANPKGKLPDDVWFLRPQEAQPDGYFSPDCDTWNESRVCGTFKEREGWHGCQMPKAVLDRIIKASSNPGDIVLDPFNGSGTTVVSAALLKRNYIGIDQSPDYVSYARKRLEHALETSSVIDGKRASRVMTQTDAFGRPRVPRRRRAAKTA
jgi:site-specific DNA-methyltransferase (adenine-specific)